VKFIFGVIVGAVFGPLVKPYIKARKARRTG
jgi:hypothetical protein